KDRIIFLPEDINVDSATTIAATLLFLDNQDNKKDISLYINCPGGTISDGLFTVYDTMQYIKSPVKTVCIGEAYSAAAVLLASGTKGKRCAFQNADIMIHQVRSLDYGPGGTTEEIMKEAKRFKKVNDKLM